MADTHSLNRRSFIKYSLAASASVATSNLLGREYILDNEFEKLTILHTNDQHSRIEPFPSNDEKYGGQAGFSRRAALIEQIRKTDKNVLLLDAGDVFQGTPYFNYFHGELEFKLMTLMGYDAITFGNHDFDMGVENIVKQMPFAGFDFVCANYDFSDTDLHKHAKISRYKIYRRGSLKIGVFGIGINPEGLIEKKNIQGLIYQDPTEEGNNTAKTLKLDEKCDFVICLSHLGYSYANDKISDLKLAALSENIDLIIGGHTHTFLNEPTEVQNKVGKTVLVNQVGWAGIWLGKIEIFFTPYKKKIFKNNSNIKIS